MLFKLVANKSSMLTMVLVVVHVEDGSSKVYMFIQLTGNHTEHESPSVYFEQNSDS